MQKDFLKFRKAFINLACSPLILMANNLELAAKYLPNGSEPSIKNSEINKIDNVLFQGFDEEQEKNLLVVENNSCIKFSLSGIFDKIFLMPKFFLTTVFGDRERVCDGTPKHFLCFDS